MCGRLNVSDDPFVTQLLLDLGIENPRQNMHFGRFKKAADTISIIIEKNGQRVLSPAIWWLLLDPSDKGFKPSKYTSFNSRFDKLNVPRSAAYLPYRHSRCIIVAKGFGETEFQQQGTRKVPKHYYDMEAVNGALALGGLYKEYVDKVSGEVVVGCSVITLPPHPKLQDIHSKASPLMLPQDATLDSWLDPNNQNVEAFNGLLQPAIRQNLHAVQVDKPSTHRPLSNPLLIKSDA